MMTSAMRSKLMAVLGIAAMMAEGVGTTHTVTSSTLNKEARNDYRKVRELGRVKRLIKGGCKEFTIGGHTVWALNLLNAKRKIANLILGTYATT